MANAVTKLSSSERFFFENAGYSWNSKDGESRIAGHVRCAKDLARAEDQGEDLGWTLEAEQDLAAVSDGEYDKVVVFLKEENGEVLEALGGVEADATNEYRRVLFAELSSQVLDRIGGAV